MYIRKRAFRRILGYFGSVGGSPPPPTSGNIITEAGDALIAAAGDNLVH